MNFLPRFDAKKTLELLGLGERYDISQVLGKSKEVQPFGDASILSAEEIKAVEEAPLGNGDPYQLYVAEHLEGERWRPHYVGRQK